jgi:hypothetical protein
MKKVAIVGLALTILVLGSALPSDAWRGHGGHFRGGVFIGAPLWWGPGWWGPGWWGPGYYGPPAVVERESPQVYLQPESQPSYWYYCQNPQGYYPYIQQCPGGWLQVVPQQAPPAR